MKTAALLTTMCLLGGCASSVAVTADGRALCGDAWKQINVRAADKLTEATAKEIEGNNLSREGIGCKYEAPAKSAPVVVASKK